jgi:hypothetical protein
MTVPTEPVITSCDERLASQTKAMGVSAGCSL